MDEDQITELREIFRSFDKNGDGSLTQLELGSLLRSPVEFSEFMALVAPSVLPSPYKSPYSEEQLRQIFKPFDRDRDREGTMNNVA
ncbi:hypothetical protein CRG98_034633 [Punica granatum]|uniref:EF-hand domain-containing protein n=1 Tax=Punica granatum TaxID=22663 RepID=A0A2I0ILW2_PUNGR|nr:hypothetical protein CRG98_034633 [Punica granatum]